MTNLILSLLRHVRPVLLPKNSKREVLARWGLQAYSRLLTLEREYRDWQKRNQSFGLTQTQSPNILFFPYQPDLSAQSCIKLWSSVSSEYVLLASAPLQLASSAIAEIERVIESYPQADLIYSDGDWLDRRGRRVKPWFKPAFAIDSLRSQNYIAPFFAIRKSFGDSVGWFDPVAGSAWAEDLIWRVVEQARQVIHIPKVLYHQTGERPVLVQDELRVLEAHLLRIGWPAQVEPGPAPHTFHLHYHLREQPLVSIIIPNHELPNELSRCVGSILEKSTYPNFEILILENNSRQAETFRLYEQLQTRDCRVRVLEYHHAPFNYSEINNFGARQARGDVLLFLNNDTEVITPNWMERMLEYAQRPDVGAVGAKMYYPQDLIQHVGVILGMFGAAGHHFANFPRNYPGYYHNTLLTQNYSAVTAACLMIRRAVFEQAGGFDPFYRLAYNDIDLCLKVREKDFLIVWLPYAELYHYESLTRGYDSNSEMLERLKRETQKFCDRWQTLLQSEDPYYNPNLALDRGYYSLRPGEYQVSLRAMPGLIFSSVGNPTGSPHANSRH